MMRITPHHNERFPSRGFSLIEMVMAVGVLSVLVLGFATAMTQMTRSQKSFSQKLEIDSLAQHLMQVMSNPANCGCLLDPLKNTANAANLVFNYSSANPLAVPPVLPSMSLPQLFSGCDAANNPTNPIATAGQPLPGTGTGLKVSSITFSSIVQVNATSNEYQGNLTVNFDPATLLIARRPITIPQRFTATGALGALSVSSCSGVSVDPKFVCENVMGFSYNPAKVPPCMIGGVAAQKLCLAFGGTVSASGTSCTVMVTPLGGSMTLPCTVPLNPSANNIAKTLNRLVALLNTPAFSNSRFLTDRIRSITGKPQSEHAAAIYELVGIDPRNKKQVVGFLRTKDWLQAPNLPYTKQQYVLDDTNSAKLLATVSEGLKGELL